MKMKKTVKNVLVTALCASFVIGGTSCSLFATDSDADYKQVITTVDITKHDDFKSGANASYVSIIQKTNNDILKRDLVSYFMNYGSTYVNSYGYSYKDTFNMLLDNLVIRKVVVQYALVYFLDSEAFSKEGYDAYWNANKTDNMTTSEEEIVTLEYFLDDEEKMKTQYTLLSAVNSSLDSTEANYIRSEEEKEYDTLGESRTTPTNANTEKEDYLPLKDGNLNYKIYSGYNTADDCGTYEKLENSTQYSRRRAYNAFLNNLSANGLLKGEDDTTDFTKTTYFADEYASQLEQTIISKFSDSISEDAKAEVTDEYVAMKYAEALAEQKENSVSEFEAMMSNISDSSLILSGKTGNFGMVYNILLPFSAGQKADLEANTKDGTKEYYHKRADVLMNIQAKDLRAGWFSNDPTANYAYKDGEKYYFFEKNMTDNDRYEELKQYAGQYAYKGNVTLNEDGTFKTVKPTSLTITEFIMEMETYIASVTGTTVSGSVYSGYVPSSGEYTMDNGNFDYSEFMYYTGKVDGVTNALDDYFVKTSTSYKAVSAVNELMFAYSTDPGCLNKYMGYTISPVTDTYVPEFAYAGDWAVGQGAGTYVVCPSTYGWHILYVSAVFNTDEIYAGYNASEKDTEGSFSNLWFNYWTEKQEGEFIDRLQKEALNKYNNDSCVTKYTDRYQDLLDMGK